MQSSFNILVGSLGIFSMAAVSHAAIWQFNFDQSDFTDPNNPDNFYFVNVGMGSGHVNNDAGVIASLTVTNDITMDLLSYSVTFDGNLDGSSHFAEGFWLVLSDGPIPILSEGILPQFYFDASDPMNPVLTAYGYNGQGNETSFFDGSSNPMMIAPPDQIYSSIADPGGSSLNVTSVGDMTTMSFSITTSILNNFAGGPDWEGVNFTENVGIWMHPVSNLETAYDMDGFLTQWDFSRQGWFDVANLPTVKIPAPATMALLGLAGLAGARRRRG